MSKAFEDQKFKPGQSGNPKGKKRGTKNWSTILKKAMNIKVEADDPRNPGQKKMTRTGEVIQLAQIRMAMKGNTRAYNAIMDRIEGKVAQPLEHGGPSGAPLPPPTIIVEGVDGTPGPMDQEEQDE